MDRINSSNMPWTSRRLPLSNGIASRFEGGELTTELGPVRLLSHLALCLSGPIRSNLRA